MLTVWSLFALISAVFCEPFWMSVKLENIRWKHDCPMLSPIGCTEQHFDIRLFLREQETTHTWPLDAVHSDMDKVDFTVEWTDGRPSDVQLATRIMGVVPDLRINKACDQSSSTRAFVESPEPVHAAPAAAPASMPIPHSVFLQARCFNASISVKTYVGRCPSCPEPKLPGMAEFEHPITFWAQLRSSDAHVQGFLVLLILTVSLLAACIVLLAYHISYRRKSSIIYNQMSRTESPDTINSSIRYGEPHLHNRPLAHYAGGYISDGTTISTPIWSASSIGYPKVGPSGTVPTTVIPIRPRHMVVCQDRISPNSSLMASEDESTYEQVV